MPTVVHTFEVGPACSGGKHANITTKRGTNILEVRRETPEQMKSDVPTDEEVIEALRTLLLGVLDFENPTSLLAAKTVIESVVIDVTWVAL